MKGDNDCFAYRTNELESEVVIEPQGGARVGSSYVAGLRPDSGDVNAAESKNVENKLHNGQVTSQTGRMASLYTRRRYPYLFNTVSVDYAAPLGMQRTE